MKGARLHRWLGPWKSQRCSVCDARRTGGTPGSKTPTAFSIDRGLTWQSVCPPCETKAVCR